MVKFNAIFLFLITYGSFNSACARENTAPCQFLILIFDYQVNFNKHINAIKLSHISNNSRMY